jgi:hypothetical protein
MRSLGSSTTKALIAEDRSSALASLTLRASRPFFGRHVAWAGDSAHQRRLLEVDLGHPAIQTSQTLVYKDESVPLVIPTLTRLDLVVLSSSVGSSRLVLCLAKEPQDGAQVLTRLIQQTIVLRTVKHHTVDWFGAGPRGHVKRAKQNRSRTVRLYSSSWVLRP